MPTSATQEKPPAGYPGETHATEKKSCPQTKKRGASLRDASSPCAAVGCVKLAADGSPISKKLGVQPSSLWLSHLL
uniref:Uncharacterized protein n=1 Tax=Rhizophora mucronata TaxID=61149 RepID=A0A2P2IN24_RHIMU